LPSAMEPSAPRASPSEASPHSPFMPSAGLLRRAFLASPIHFYYSSAEGQVPSAQGFALEGFAFSPLFVTSFLIRPSASRASPSQPSVDSPLGLRQDQRSLRLLWTPHWSLRDFRLRRLLRRAWPFGLSPSATPAEGLASLRSAWPSAICFSLRGPQPSRDPSCLRQGSLLAEALFSSVRSTRHSLSSRERLRLPPPPSLVSLHRLSLRETLRLPRRSPFGPLPPSFFGSHRPSSPLFGLRPLGVIFDSATHFGGRLADPSSYVSSSFSTFTSFTPFIRPRRTRRGRQASPRGGGGPRTHGEG
jgi:hypothetical protein